MLLITEESSESHPSNGELNDFQLFETYLEEVNCHIAIMGPATIVYPTPRCTWTRGI